MRLKLITIPEDIYIYQITFKRFLLFNDECELFTECVWVTANSIVSRQSRTHTLPMRMFICTHFPGGKEQGTRNVGKLNAKDTHTHTEFILCCFACCYDA